MLDNFKRCAEWERFELDDVAADHVDLMTAGFSVAFYQPQLLDLQEAGVDPRLFCE